MGRNVERSFWVGEEREETVIRIDCMWRESIFNKRKNTLRVLLKVWESGSGSDRTLPENVRPWLLYEQRHKKSPKKKRKKEKSSIAEIISDHQFTRSTSKFTVVFLSCTSWACTIAMPAFASEEVFHLDLEAVYLERISFAWTLLMFLTDIKLYMIIFILFPNLIIRNSPYLRPSICTLSRHTPL